MNVINDQINELVESQVNSLIQDDSYYQGIATPLKPAAAFKREHRKQLEDFFKLNGLRKQFEEAPNIILDYLPELVNPLEFSRVKTELDQSSENFMKYFETEGDQPSEKPVLFQEMFGFSDDTLLNVYALGVDLVRKKDYERANALFVFLSTLAPHVTSYWIAQGVCLQSLNRHEDAVTIFNTAKILNPLDPSISAYTIESYLVLKENDKAKLELDVLKEVTKFLSGDEKVKWETKIIELS